MDDRLFFFLFGCAVGAVAGVIGVVLFIQSMQQHYRRVRR